MTAPRTRFYREVSVQSPSVGAKGYSILLDGKAVKTPSGAALLLPNRKLAEAVAEEWRIQVDKIRAETMILTKLANTAIDRVVQNRTAVVTQVLAFGRSDLVCYRTEAPPDLAARQAREWDPLLEWAKVRHGAELKTATGIGFVEQSPAALAALEGAISARGDFSLAALHGTAQLTGSAVIALALADGRLDAKRAFAVANLDELHQAERWGRDAEADSKAQTRAYELVEITRFLQLLQE